MSFLKNSRRLFCLLGLHACILSVSQAGEVVWHPLVGNGADEFAPILHIGQIGSEVYMATGVAANGSSCDMRSEPISVEFPTLFVVSCDYGFPHAADISLWGSTTSGSYDYDIGDGWIFHRRGYAYCKPVTEALGWIYIKHYPWVFTPGSGWRYVVEAGHFEFSNAWWFYEPVYGWFWTTRDLYPVIYHSGVGWTQYGLVQ